MSTLMAWDATGTLGTSGFDRTHFGILASGFTYAFVLKYVIVLLTRTKIDVLAFTILITWFLYITLQLIDLWARRTSGPSPGFPGPSPPPPSSWTEDGLEVVWLCVFGVVLGMRVARSGILFVRTGLTERGETEGGVGVATILPSFILRLVLDGISIHKLHKFRRRYIEAGGKEAFRVIVSSLIVESIFTLFALIIGIQEAMNYTGPKFSFVDWFLISWCLGSWVDQKALYLQIFGNGSVGAPTSFDVRATSREDDGRQSTSSLSALSTGRGTSTVGSSERTRSVKGEIGWVRAGREEGFEGSGLGVETGREFLERDGEIRHEDTMPNSVQQ
ncbi:hypothetical protein BC829DRAFT_444655 [Chytridium lagenaria]|nr:hypothetical protein BC829DRAFT_444655 [Chytridium lagenaria]